MSQQDETARKLQRLAIEGDEGAEVKLRRMIVRTTKGKVHYTLDNRTPRCGQLRGAAKEGHRSHRAETIFETAAVDPSGNDVTCQKCLLLMLRTGVEGDSIERDVLLDSGARLQGELPGTWIRNVLVDVSDDRVNSGWWADGSAFVIPTLSLHRLVEKDSTRKTGFRLTEKGVAILAALVVKPKPIGVESSVRPPHDGAQ